MEKITILPTREMMTIDGVRGRVWEGISESGVRCKLLVHRIAVIDGQDDGAFVRGLLEMPEPLELKIEFPDEPEY